MLLVSGAVVATVALEVVFEAVTTSGSTVPLETTPDGMMLVVAADLEVEEDVVDVLAVVEEVLREVVCASA